MKNIQLWSIYDPLKNVSEYITKVCQYISINTHFHLSKMVSKLADNYIYILCLTTYSSYYICSCLFLIDGFSTIS